MRTSDISRDVQTLPEDIVCCVLEYFTPPEIYGCAGHLRAVRLAVLRHQMWKAGAGALFVPNPNPSQQLNFWPSTTFEELLLTEYQDELHEHAYDDEQIRSRARFPSVFRFPGMVMGRYVSGAVIA